MKKIKQVFPSRNYITVDSYGDVEVVFNPVGDGFEGDDKLMFRKGRWAFRVNDFLSGKIMADGSKEGMGRKVYSLNLVYDDKDGEPIVNTTYVDPTSVIPLDGSVVDVVGSEKLAQEETLQTVAKEGTLQTVSKDVEKLVDLNFVCTSHGGKAFTSFYGDKPYFLPSGCLIAFFDEKGIEREFYLSKTQSIMLLIGENSITYYTFVGEFVKFSRSSGTNFEIVNGFNSTSRKFRIYEPSRSFRQFK